MAKRGRPPRESLLAVRLRQRLENPPVRLRGINPPLQTIADIERHLGLPADSLRDICRGRVGRNRAHKIGIIARVASFLGFPLDELSGLAGLTTVDRKPIDLGTPEAILLRTNIAKGGDPRLCGTALGVLLAHGEVGGCLGISQGMHDAGERFCRLATQVLYGRQKSKPSTLARLASEFDASGLPPTDASIAYIHAAYAGARRWLTQVDAEARFSAFDLREQPSRAVWAVAVQCELPWWALYDLRISAEVEADATIPAETRDALISARIAEQRPGALAGWLTLRLGLNKLQRFFRSPEHADLWRRYQDDDEAERFGIAVEERGGLVADAMARLSRCGGR